LNYGYAGDESARVPVLAEEDECNRVCIGLYDRVAAAIDLRGTDILEVSCGHGGGASYIARYLAPRSVRGIDRNRWAIEFCKSKRKVNNLFFSQGDALALEFADGTFDVVVNIEASHCYGDFARFLGEVRRVLRPGGHFLFADFRRAMPQRANLHRQIEQSGLEILRCHDIGPYVLKGMQLNSDRNLQLIRRLLPGFLRKPAMGFAGVKGSGIYQSLESGATVYFCYMLRKTLAS
jgi:SAM-dependent methyltransferase